MYSWARWTGLRVWKPTTVFQPCSSKAARVSLGSRRWSWNSVYFWRWKRVTSPPSGDLFLGVDGRDAGVLVLVGAVDEARLFLLVVVVGLGDVHDGERDAVFADEGDLLAFVGLRVVAGGGEGDRQRPRQRRRRGACP